jgi:hypothetical protein
MSADIFVCVMERVNVNVLREKTNVHFGGNRWYLAYTIGAYRTIQRKMLI